MFIAIKKGKIWDICSELQYKRTKDSLLDDKYFKITEKDLCIGDTWEFGNGISLKDSPLRDVVVVKSLEQRIKDIEVSLVGIL